MRGNSDQAAVSLAIRRKNVDNNDLDPRLEIGKKLRSIRLEQKLSLRELAEKAEVSASLLSQIENGKANPSVRSLYSIAEALALPVNYFFPNESGSRNSDGLTGDEASVPLTASEARTIQEATPDEVVQALGIALRDENPTNRGPVVRADSRSIIELQGNVAWSRLTPDQEEMGEFLQICYDMGATSGAKLSRHSGREFGFILKGALTVELGFDSYLLKPGDSIIFDSETPHRLTNHGNVPVEALWVIFKRR